MYLFYGCCLKLLFKHKYTLQHSEVLTVPVLFTITKLTCINGGINWGRLTANVPFPCLRPVFTFEKCVCLQQRVEAICAGRGEITTVTNIFLPCNTAMYLMPQECVSLTNYRSLKSTTFPVWEKIQQIIFFLKLLCKYQNTLLVSWVITPSYLFLYCIIFGQGCGIGQGVSRWWGGGGDEAEGEENRQQMFDRLSSWNPPVVLGLTIILNAHVALWVLHISVRQC